MSCYSHSSLLFSHSLTLALCFTIILYLGTVLCTLTQTHAHTLTSIRRKRAPCTRYKPWTGELTVANWIFQGYNVVCCSCPKGRYGYATTYLNPPRNNNTPSLPSATCVWLPRHITASHLAAPAAALTPFVDAAPLLSPLPSASEHLPLSFVFFFGCLPRPYHH